MADVYMHSRLTEELINELKSDINQHIAFLGSQGPDALYYTRVPKHKQLADDIHRYRTKEFFKTMINYVKEHNSLETYSFLIGFISHYVMDVYIHPYVYYFTGEYRKEDPSTHHLRGYHLKFERTIDCLLIEKEQRMPSRKMNLTKKYFPLKEAPIEVCKLMEHTLQLEHQYEDGFQAYNQSAKAMYQALKYIITDRFGLKKMIYKIVDFFVKDNDLLLTDLSLSRKTNDFDYHNDLKNIWKHPITGEAYTKTVEELFSEAKEYAKKIINQVDAFLNGDKIDLDTVFPNLSFNTGIDCKYGMDFKYLDIYKK